MKSSFLDLSSHICCSIKFSCVFLLLATGLFVLAGSKSPEASAFHSPNPLARSTQDLFFFFFQKSPVFYGLAPKRKQHTSQEQEGMKLFQIPGPQTVLMPPKSLIAAHHPLLPLLCHSRSSPAAGITSIIGFFTVRMPHRNDIIPSLSTWSHSFPMLALANISSSSTTTYKPPM